MVSRSRTSRPGTTPRTACIWTGVLGYRGVVSHRVPQRRLRGVRVRLAVGDVRPFVRVREARTPASISANAVRATRSITDVTAEYNQLGYSGTNAGGDLFIVRSVWRNNRTGIVPNSLDFEALAPQGHATYRGQLDRHERQHRRREAGTRSGTSSMASASASWAEATTRSSATTYPEMRSSASRSRRIPASAGAFTPRPATWCVGTTPTERAWPTSPPCS